ncbi:MAG: Glutamate-tRNA ligase [Candidatus Woesebacteria bacterium GW2011_GWA1_44_23]|uniref:Glutamate--tRNA ligase n=1 Tax=Candidatus Woesebacteria bacterium GW2011_GWA1_44_23 TaxID=1618558 RepID=A0A837I9X9_9BACT|nr:MAG: Glutamate-tRNA ligase [Candidatus Woesebacteria bacterium GW2011_GWA1_44_23]
MLNAKLDVKIEAMSKVRTRFAPSPTGFLHIGGLRTALYAYALAKHDKGDFILRIEDTDQKRQVEGATESLKETLKKFGLAWDEFYTQSERLSLYSEAAKKLVGEGHAFYCQCKPRNAKEGEFSNKLRDPCRDKGYTMGAVRLKVPEGETLSYFDFVHRKEISWSSDTVYDATLLKSDGFPTYHLAVAVDDLDMKVSHILRGHDWLPSTPIHLLVFKYLGGVRPEIGHLTDILSAETGKKLSKRRDSVFVEQFLENGYLPEALLNFVMLLGWAPKDNRELFTLSEFVEHFDMNGFQEANPRFLIDKLDWFNGYYIRQKTDEELLKLLGPFVPKDASEEKLKKVIPLIKDRIKKLSDFESFAGFFFEERSADKKLFGKDYKKHLEKALEAIEKGVLLDQVPKDNNFKVGDFFMDLRIAITGSKFTPPINESIEVLGREEAAERIRKILD